MRLILQEIGSPKSAVHKALVRLRDSIDNSDVWFPLDDTDFVFLCGANRAPGVPSRRREALLLFADKNLPNAKFFLAENIFDTLIKEGHKTNILDIEADLFDFSDYVIIILESESAFCELGAFSAQRKNRSKIIVINDIQHIKSSSFINIGPIKAITESAKHTNILHYIMSSQGCTEGDAIGDIFGDLHHLLDRKKRERRSRVKQVDPTRQFTKSSVRFLHDLIYFAGPIGFKEIDIALKILFTNSNHNKLRNHLGILKAINQVCISDSGEGNFYSSSIGKPYYEYDVDTGNIISAFKNAYFKHCPKRLNEAT